MNRIALDLGIIQIYWYSLFIFLGIITATIVICYEAKKKNIEEEFLLNLTFNVIVFGIIGARLYYVVFNLPYYLENPIEILEIWNGGLAIHGGLLAGFITTYVYCKRHNEDFMKLLDIIVIGLIIAQAIGRWGNFFNGEAYGYITTATHLKSMGIPKFVIDGMYIMGDYRKPTFFYESVWCFFGFIGMQMIKRYKYLEKGQLTGFYLLWYGTIRLFIEEMRADSLMIGSFKMAQIVSIIFMFTGVLLISCKKLKKK